MTTFPNPPRVNGPRYFNVTEYEKFMDMVSEPILKLTFKKLAPAKFWWTIKA